MLGEVNREEQVGIKYRYDQRTGQEIIVIPTEWLEKNIASTEIEKESFKRFGEEACRGKGNVCNRVEQCKKFDEQNELRDKELKTEIKKEEDDRQRRETLTHADTECKEKRRLQEETRERFTSKLEKVVTAEGFEYYVDRSSANEGEDDLFFMRDSDQHGIENEETELPPMFFVYTHEKSLKDVTLMAPEFSSLVGSGEVDMRKIESIHRTFAVSLTDDNLRVNLIHEIGTVIEEFPWQLRKGVVYLVEMKRSLLETKIMSLRKVMVPFVRERRFWFLALYRLTNK